MFTWLLKRREQPEKVRRAKQRRFKRPRLEQLENRFALAMVPANFTDTQQMASGLTNATAMEIAPDGKLFIAEQAGTMEVWENGTRLQFNFFQNQPFTPYDSGTDLGFLDNRGERGLLGVTFDPNYATNRYVFVYYTYAVNPDGGSSAGTTIRNRVTRFTANATGDLALAGSEFVIMELDNLSGATNHNGGAIHFGPDNMLYVAVGDNATGTNAQTVANRHGKMLRIDVTSDFFTGDPGQNWNIPAGNPTNIPGIAASIPANSVNRAIWAAGLRNPFTFGFQPGTGRLHINDVGQNTWEEINIGAVGANYGWPNTEGDFTQSSFPNFTRPYYSYAHGGGGFQGFAITGGAFYNPSSPGINRFPTSYDGDYFFGDVVNNWINVIDLNTGVVSQFVTGANGVVDLRVANDGTLYYLARNLSQVRRVVYTANSAPNITQQPANQSTATNGSATFTVAANGSTPLTYQWQRADSATPTSFSNISGATSASYQVTNAQAADNGDRFRVIVTNPFGNQTSSAATLTVSSNQAPQNLNITVNSGLTGGRFNAGQAITFSGTASDPEDGGLGAANFTWQVDYITSIASGNPIVRPFVPAFSNQTGGQFTPATTGPYTLTDVAYRITFTATDSQSTSSTFTLDVLPNTATLTVTTSPSGLQVTVDGQPFTAPRTFASVVGFERPIGAAANQSQSGTNYAFSSWSDSGAATHTISTPATNTTYTANFQVVPGLIIDNGDSGFATTGTWSYAANPSVPGFQTDVHTATAGTGSSVATWTFTGLTPGLYRVSATWNTHANRATNSPFTVLDGSTVRANVALNQELAPNDLSSAGANWEDLATAAQIGSGTLVVRLTNNANEYVIADAVRIERVGDLPPTSVVILDNGDGGFATTGTWSYAANPSVPGFQTDVHTAMAGAGSSVATWTFTGVTPGVYRVSATWNTNANRATNAPFRVFDGSTSRANVAINQELAPNDLSAAGANWEDLAASAQIGSGTLVVQLTNAANEYVIADAIRIERVGNLPVNFVTILDNGASGFATTGAWTYAANPAVPGFQTDVHHAVAGTGSSVATWTFMSLPAGTYRVSATWNANPNRATNAPFTVLDGASAVGNVSVNQETVPNDFSEGGVGWRNLGTFTISSGTLMVRLTNNANEYVVADAIRIERLS